MSTMPDTPTGSPRAFRIAVVASLLVHLIAIVFALAVNDGLHRFAGFRAPVHLARKRPDEVVTISSAIRFEKRARPVPEPQRPIARRALPPVVAPQKPAYAAPALLRHELAKVARASAPPLRVAPPVRAPPVTRPEPTRPIAPIAPMLTQERLAQIDRDLAKTVAQVRAYVDPMRTVVRERPAAPVHYRVQMEGKSGSLHRGQGTYSPIKAWHADGLDFYYVTYEYVYPDGTYETGSVPWPIHFRPAKDPFANDRLDLLARTPLPSPPNDYVPPGTLGKALRVYFPNLRFSDAN